MTDHIDQMNSEIRLESNPSRIISLVPSQTELLHYLNLGDEVIGITKFCIHPKKWHEAKTIIGGTKNVDIEKVRGLKPDLIIGNKEENSKADILKLKEFAPVWMSDIYTLEDSLDMILQVGQLTNRAPQSLELIEKIKSEFNDLKEITTNFPRTSTLYFMWHNPSMIAGNRTFIGDMLDKCGLENVANIERYEELKKDKEVDLVLLSSEPFPFREKHIKEYQSRFPKANVCIVDGEMFSWYGSKLKEAPKYFANLLNDLMS